jgi:hypothetical protein
MLWAGTRRPTVWRREGQHLVPLKIFNNNNEIIIIIIISASITDQTKTGAEERIAHCKVCICSFCKFKDR